MSHMLAHEVEWTDELIEKLGKDMVAWLEQEGNLWFRGWLAKRWIGKETLHYLIERFPTFAAYHDLAVAMQEQKLVELSFSKKGDGNFAKFILSNRHENWIERTHNKLDVSVDPFSGILEASVAVAELPGSYSNTTDLQPLELPSEPATDSNNDSH